MTAMQQPQPLSLALFELAAELHRSGSGAVFEATDVRNGRRVAIKRKDSSELGERKLRSGRVVVACIDGSCNVWLKLIQLYCSAKIPNEIHGRVADSARKDLAALGPSRASTSAPPSWSSCLPSEDLTWLKIWRARAISGSWPGAQYSARARLTHLLGELGGSERRLAVLVRFFEGLQHHLLVLQRRAASV